MDEPVTTLASPASANPAIPAYQYSFGANPVATLVTANPLLCGNTAAGTGTNPAGIATVYYSANGSTGTTPKPFVFGAASATPTVSATAYGATNVVYNGSQVQFGGDPLDALVCYALNANGVHKVTRDLFADGFEIPGTDGLIGNSTVTVSVFHLPAGAPNNYYGYNVDVTIPSLPSGTTCGSSGLDCDFSLIEGYDTSVFDPNQGGWCLVSSAGAQSCPGATTLGNININYGNYGSTTSLAAPVGSAQPLQAHFVVFRYFASGVTTLPSSGAPVVMAALFSPLDLLENKLDDNVATGNNTLANVAPSVSTDSAFTTGAASLQENTNSGTFTFTITDPDSSESTGHVLTASVTLNLPNGIQVPIDAQNCDSSSTNYQSAPVSRTCTFSIPLSNATFWDSALMPGQAAYQGQFNNIATDTTNGTYASGVSAGIKIVATDAQGKNSAAVTTPVHIFSTKNDAPVVTFGSTMPGVSDTHQTGTPSYPTYTCSISAGSGAGGCGAADPRTPTLISINVSGITATPGPAAAFDELATQTTVAIAYAGLDGGNVACSNEQTADVFAPASGSFTGGGPLFSSASGAGTSSVAYGMNFVIPSTAPATSVSALCTLNQTIADQMQGTSPPPFPNSETQAYSAAQFRIVVNP